MGTVGHRELGGFSVLRRPPKKKKGKRKEKEKRGKKKRKRKKRGKKEEKKGKGGKKGAYAITLLHIQLHKKNVIMFLPLKYMIGQKNLRLLRCERKNLGLLRCASRRKARRPAAAAAFFFFRQPSIYPFAPPPSSIRTSSLRL